MSSSTSPLATFPPATRRLLTRLHALSASQERSLSQTLFYLNRLFRYYLFGETWAGAAGDLHMRDKLVALEPDKCALVYLVARARDVRVAVEAGTSFGVSTVYLARAVAENVEEAARAGGGEGGRAAGRVVATEKEPTKAAQARRNWAEAGEDDVARWIDLREGDLLETLSADDMPDKVDLVLLDSESIAWTSSQSQWQVKLRWLTNVSNAVWTPLALPTLQILQPRLSRGAVIITDNTSIAKPLYKEFLSYIHNPENGFKTMTLPFGGGLEMTVYLPTV